MFQWLKRWRLRHFPKYRRLEGRFLRNSMADALIRQNPGKPERERWEIAVEENNNPIIGLVFLERRERIWE
jgi:hypothetical protein